MSSSLKEKIDVCWRGEISREELLSGLKTGRAGLYDGGTGLCSTAYAVLYVQVAGVRKGYLALPGFSHSSGEVCAPSILTEVEWFDSKDAALFYVLYGRKYGEGELVISVPGDPDVRGDEGFAVLEFGGNLYVDEYWSCGCGPNDQCGHVNKSGGEMKDYLGPKESFRNEDEVLTAAYFFLSRAA